MRFVAKLHIMCASNRALKHTKFQVYLVLLGEPIVKAGVDVFEFFSMPETQPLRVNKLLDSYRALGYTHMICNDW